MPPRCFYTSLAAFALSRDLLSFATTFEAELRLEDTPSRITLPSKIPGSLFFFSSARRDDPAVPSSPVKPVGHTAIAVRMRVHFASSPPFLRSQPRIVQMSEARFCGKIFDFNG